MKNEKFIRHEAMDKVRNDLKTSMDRYFCIDKLRKGEIAADKREMYLRLLQKKDYVLGLEYQYTKLAQVIRLKKDKTPQEEKFLEFVKKNA